MSKINGHKIGAIKRAIENHIHPDNNRSFIYAVYRNWYIGVTNNPNVRKAQHENQKQLTALHFQFWEADTKENALEVELYFHELGMLDKHGQGGIRNSSTVVYVFKIKPHALDWILDVLE